MYHFDFIFSQITAQFKTNIILTDLKMSHRIQKRQEQSIGVRFRKFLCIYKARS